MKNTIRKEYLLKRDFLNIKDIKEKSEKIWEKILQTNEFKICENVFVFLSFGNEIDTKKFILKCFEKNKTVCVPIIKGKRQMEFSKIENFNNLMPNKYGILEPNFKNIIKANKNTLIIVPAIVYSLEKYRIGYGGGFYDIYLKENERLASFGVCLEEFILNKIEPEKYDEKVDFVFTQNRYF